MFEIISLLVIACLIIILIRKQSQIKALKNLSEKDQSTAKKLTMELEQLKNEIIGLSPFKDIRDISLEMERIRNETNTVILKAREKAGEIIKLASLEARERQDQSDSILR